jgi:hypothetical protein
LLEIAGLPAREPFGSQLVVNTPLSFQLVRVRSGLLRDLDRECQLKRGREFHPSFASALLVGAFTPFALVPTAAAVAVLCATEVKT